MNDASIAPIYPRYCFHLAPTVNTWCLFRIADIHKLKQHSGFEGEGFYFYKSLPIKWVRIVGIVVAIDEYSGRRIYTVDDSSGACIECMITMPTSTLQTEPNGLAADRRVEADQRSGNAKPISVPQLYVDIDVGSVVDVKGGLSTFREEKQITIEKMVLLKCTAQEVALWEKRAKFQKEVLDQPWVLRNRDIRRCRKEAERSEEEAERKRKRLKTMIEGQTRRTETKRSEKVARDASKEPIQDGRRVSNRQKVDLKQVIQNGAKGKYDALGL